jgi:hypothetical protein
MVHGQRLKTEVDFHNANLFGIAVSVTKDGQHVGSGHIISQSKYVVKMIDGLYFKDDCIFTVCSAVLKNRNTK